MPMCKLGCHCFCRATILPLIKRFMFFGIKGTKKILNRQTFGGIKTTSISHLLQSRGLSITDESKDQQCLQEPPLRQLLHIDVFL